MTTPTRISTETLAGRTFTIDRALFVTSRGGCGVRLIRQIDRKRVTEQEFLHAMTEAREAAKAAA